jgi:phosphoribosylanthranilate isomerase
MDVRVKHCGITRPEDAVLCADHGAWAVGLILVPGSPRALTPDRAARVVAAVRRRVEIVGVFQNAPLDEVTGIADALALTAVQLHGDEGVAYATEVARRTGARVIKAARVRTRGDVQALQAFSRVDLHLLDGPGGGATFDWALARARRSEVPLVLAGGLTPENVGDAIAATGPWAVDVAGGTESEPGVKDPAKVAAFAEAVRAAAVEQPA